MFGRYGLPEVLVSDNSPEFTSVDFRTFLKRNGVKHMRTAPFHPATNGQAERFVQTLKRSLKASRGTLTLQHRVDAFLFSYRNTPHMTTKESPAMPAPLPLGLGQAECGRHGGAGTRGPT